jgi:transcriptional regulator with XRE-family HTH domain
MTTTEKLAAAMKKKKMIREDGSLDAVALSEASGVSDNLIRRYLDGEVTVGIKNAPRLAKALGIKPTDLIAFAA